MSFHFSANQYEDAFVGKKLRNYTLPRKYKERPKPFDGYTQFIANDRGHLLDSVPRSKESPWGTFMGTWCMPLSIPPSRPSYTARSKAAAEKLKYFKDTSPFNNARNGFKPFPCEKKKHNVKNPATPPPSFAKSPGRATQSQASSRSGAASDKQKRPVSADDLKVPGSPHPVVKNPSPSSPILPNEKSVKIDLEPTHDSCPPSRLSAAGGSPTKLINDGVVLRATPNRLEADEYKRAPGFGEVDTDAQALKSPVPSET